MQFEILDEITNAETIATGSGIRELASFRKLYGLDVGASARDSRVRLRNGEIVMAAVHWDEAGHVGKRELKTKRFL